jgi:conjugative relaxase-like TrwC/TraI family protein
MAAMMSLSNHSLDAAQAANYFENHYSQDDYYTQNQRCVGRWIGRGAAGLGLAGEVSREDFSTLLQGVHPRTGAVLVPAAVGSGKHAAGWDSVFSAPKSVSIQALVGDDSRLIRAHIAAAERAITEVEHYALARRRGGREHVVSGNIVGATFNHMAARPVGDSGHGPDPQLHTHVVLLNATQRPDGKWCGLSPVEIYRSQTLGTAIYRSELAREVQKLGYRIQVTTGNGAWELEGYTREQVVAFSQRRQDIERHMAEAGLKGAAAAQFATLKTRQAKADYDESELKAEWRARALSYGINVRAHLWQALGRGNIHTANSSHSPVALEFARTHTTERDAVIDRRALEAAALQHGMGRVDLAAIRERITIAEQSRTLIRAEKPDWRHPRGTFTTDEMLELERDNMALVHAGIGQAQAIAEPAEVQEWGAVRGLFADQIEAAKLTLNSRNWASAIEGLAGTAKTTTVGAIRDFAEGRGYNVRGFGMTSGSVKALREAGVNARTIASLLQNPLPPRTGPELWIVDESSLLATRPTNRILKAARQQGVERILFVGDQRQHHPIEAGAPVRQLLANNMAVAELKVIRRQRDPELKRAVELAASGKPGAALGLLAEQRRLTEIRDTSARYQRIALDCLRAHAAGQQTLVISPGNDERQALNQEIRKLLIEKGHVQNRGCDHTILVRRDLTRAQLAHARNYQQGDVLLFSRGSKKRGIAKGANLSVENVDAKRNALTLRMGDGTRTTLNPARWRGVEVFHPETRAIALGDRIQFRAPQRSLKVANGEFATIIALDTAQATLRLDSKREISAPLVELRHIDLGYASTSHAAQGATVDRVIVNVDTLRSDRLVNARQLYVSISRARFDAHLYTNDVQALGPSVARDPHKANALDALTHRLTTKLRARGTTELHSHTTAELRVSNVPIQPLPAHPQPIMRITR